MKSLKHAVDDYLALRRSLGFKLAEYGVDLQDFVSFLEKNGSARITIKLALEYATQRQDEKPVSWSRRLGIIRGFARYRIGADPKTEVPPLGLLKFRSQRATPYLYSGGEIRRLLEAALQMNTHYELQCHTYYCLFGLLAVTGLRVGEAIRLQAQDVDLLEGILTVRGTKFGKSRLVPVAPSTRAVLREYAKRRDQFLAGRPAPHFLVSTRGKRLQKQCIGKIFRSLSRQIGIRKAGKKSGPRLHDFRHRFAIETLLRWYRNGQQATHLMPVLSTYLGHGNVTDTYWYLSSTPELIVAASKLIETRWKGVA
jgi:integrase